MRTGSAGNAAISICRLLILAMLAAMGRAAYAQSWPDAAPGQLIGVPVYDPEAKRYFALMHTEPCKWGCSWEKVAQQARDQSYKGVHGRLAIVDSIDVHEFLLRTFHPSHYQYIWIGLRYLCRAKKLEWSDGRIFQRGSFQAWDPKWNQDVYVCHNVRYDPNEWAPVAYSPQFKWIVKGRGKGYDWYFVEFPTGHP
jgi:hypothetical protein